VVKGFTRQFLYIRPGIVVIFDRVTAAHPQDAKHWYLHTMEKPECIDGELTPDTRVHPQGHFVAAGRTLRVAHGGSVLFSKTLLPELAEIRVQGGKGHQFEVNGENFDMYDAWWKKVGTPQYQEEIGIGWWRAEVEPRSPSAEDVFLHVLWATDDDTPAMFPVEKVSKQGQAGARFSAEGLDVEVIFATTGEVAGCIKLTRGGQVVCDRPLASAIEDDYQKWHSDSRFDAWMTNPYMRSAVGVTKK